MNAAGLGGVAIGLFVVFLLWNTRGPAAVGITVRNDQLVVRMRGWDVIYCCRRQVSVPLEAVDGVCVAPRDAVPAEGLRLPGASIPGVIRAGSYGSGDARDLWDVRRAEQVLVLQMKPAAADYRRIVLEVPDAHSEMLRLRPTLGATVLPLSATV